MDPSEIIKVPLQLRRLYSFAFFPVVVIMLKWVKDSPQRLTTKIMSLLKLTLTVYGLFGLCGTNIVDNYKHSLTAALYVASLVSTTWKTTAAEEASASASNSFFLVIGFSYYHLTLCDQYFADSFVVGLPCASCRA